MDDYHLATLIPLPKMTANTNVLIHNLECKLWSGGEHNSHKPSTYEAY